MSPAAAELRREAIRDAAIAGSQVGLVRAFLERAHDAAIMGAPLEQQGALLRQAKNELEALRLTLRDHFDRLGAPPSLELNRP